MLKLLNMFAIFCATTWPDSGFCELARNSWTFSGQFLAYGQQLQTWSFAQPLVFWRVMWHLNYGKKIRRFEVVISVLVATYAFLVLLKYQVSLIIHHSSFGNDANLHLNDYSFRKKERRVGNRVKGRGRGQIIANLLGDKEAFEKIKEPQKRRIIMASLIKRQISSKVSSCYL